MSGEELDSSQQLAFPPVVSLLFQNRTLQHMKMQTFNSSICSHSLTFLTEAVTYELWLLRNSFRKPYSLWRLWWSPFGITGEGAKYGSMATQKLEYFPTPLLDFNTLYYNSNSNSPLLPSCPPFIPPFPPCYVTGLRTFFPAQHRHLPNLGSSCSLQEITLAITWVASWLPRKLPSIGTPPPPPHKWPTWPAFIIYLFEYGLL